MKKIFFSTILIIFSLIFIPSIVLANNEHSHESEIKEGKDLIESKVSCKQLTDDQLEVIGEYLMEQMHPGEAHNAMHKMMNMEEGTEYHKNFHINMAKRMYCQESGTMSMMPMMMGSNMMGGGDNSMAGNMMGWAGFGWLWMFLFWILIIVGIVVLIKWLMTQNKNKVSQSALDMLKERYAKGEIDKKEFEEKKSDLN